MTTLSEDTIKKAVEIAPGWKWTGPNGIILPDGAVWECAWAVKQQWPIDALAAALVRVIEDKGCAGVYPVQGMTEVQWEYETSDNLDSITIEGPDRTENTINAIVEFADKHPEVFK